jgi:hemerythrin
MYLQWSDDLMVGVPRLDQQHKNILRAAWEMLEAMSKGEGQKKYFSLMEHLDGYIHEHFDLEQELMIAHRYPGYDEHRGRHADFIRGYNEYKKRFETEGVSAYLIIQTQRWLHEWLVDHLRNTDAKMVEFLKPLLNDENPGEPEGKIHP